jgi:hypothetical protein
MPDGPSSCSITPKTSWRFDRLEFGEIEFDNCPQGLGKRTVLLVFRQRVQPAGILGLQLDGHGDGVVPPLDPGAAGRPGGVCGQPVRQPRARCDSVPDAWRRSWALHRPMDGAWVPLLIVTLRLNHEADRPVMPPWTGADRSRRSSSSPRPCGPFCSRARRRQVCAACGAAAPAASPSSADCPASGRH